MDERTCADCGVRIELVRNEPGRWGVKLGSNAWSMSCRVVIDDVTGRMLLADYHHPADEPQRQFTAHWDDTVF